MWVHVYPCLHFDFLATWPVDSVTLFWKVGCLLLAPCLERLVFCAEGLLYIQLTLWGHCISRPPASLFQVRHLALESQWWSCLLLGLRLWASELTLRARHYNPHRVRLSWGWKEVSLTAGACHGRELLSSEVGVDLEVMASICTHTPQELC